MATISTTGDVLMTILLIHRRMIDDVIWGEWWQDEENFMIHSNNISCITAPIFTESLIEIVLKYISWSLQIDCISNIFWVCSFVTLRYPSQWQNYANVDNKQHPIHDISIKHIPFHSITSSRDRCCFQWWSVRNTSRSTCDISSWQIIKILQTMRHITESFNNRGVPKRGLAINPRVFSRWFYWTLQIEWDDQLICCFQFDWIRWKKWIDYTFTKWWRISICWLRVRASFSGVQR
jgi:hypothetical protein